MAHYHSYSPREGHGLPHDPFKALIAPRPIGWISTLGPNGTKNLAPYSFFNAVSDSPPMIMFSSSGEKDSYRNAVETGEFVHNLVSEELAQSMVRTSAALQPDQSEFAHANIEWTQGEMVSAPRVLNAMASLECVVTQHQELKTQAGDATGSFLVVGEVVRVHIDNRVLRDGMVDEAALKLISRLGYRSYGLTDNIFEMARPKKA